MGNTPLFMISSALPTVRSWNIGTRPRPFPRAASGRTKTANFRNTRTRPTTIEQKTMPQEEKTPIEAAGYIAGTLTAVAQMVMPVRMWITLIASTVLLVFVFRSESPLNVARALCIYVSLIAVLIGSAVFSKRLRR